MLHLMLKDFYTQRKVAYFAPILLSPYFLTMGDDISDSGFIGMLFNSLTIAFVAHFITMYSNFNTVENEKNQNRLLLSLPVTRRSVIEAKYTMVSVWWLFSYISYLVIFIVLINAFHFENNSLFDMKAVLLSFCFTYLLTSVFYPLHYKFGYRTASLIGILMFFLLSMGAGKLLSLSKNTHVFSLIMEQPILSCLIFTVLFVLVSYLLSVHFFTKKDF